MKFQKPKGTNDFYPKEQEARNRIFNIFRNIAKSYNFKEVDSPVFENLDLLTAKSGSEIVNQIFTLEKRSNEQLGLRFDLTIPLVRMFVQKEKELVKPVKWFYISKMWRYENPQQGREREFTQLGVEIFGSDKAEADAEILALAIDFLLCSGLKKNDFIILINNRKLMEELLLDLNIENKNVINIIDKFRKITREEFNRELKNLGLNNEQISAINKLLKINSIKELKKIKPNSKGIDELQRVLDVLKIYDKDKFVKIDLSVVRGLAYYTGTIFECFDKNFEFRSIFAGGRYDNLVEQLYERSCPATGLAIGDATLKLLLEKKELWPKVELRPDYFIATVNKDVLKDAIKIANKLRDKYVVEIDLIQRNLTKQLDYANKTNAKNVVIIGPKEIAKKKVKIKDMKTGKEKLVKVSSL